MKRNHEIFFSFFFSHSRLVNKRSSAVSLSAPDFMILGHFFAFAFVLLSSRRFVEERSVQVMNGSKDPSAFDRAQ